ncbi:hypothetical protein [Peptoniphilus senegalensis]|uniref:hypothetical protein n=1 Tax=Peptoniphilus senegalensis TaxID=1465757 RepID=UPI0002DCC2BE|nr:hypothetical protein [Peptoniphilus senegalensis]
MKKLKSLIKLIAFIRFIKPKRRRRIIKLMPLLNPKRAGKVAYHAGRIRMRNEIKRLLY